VFVFVLAALYSSCKSYTMTLYVTLYDDTSHCLPKYSVINTCTQKTWAKFARAHIHSRT